MKKNRLFWQITLAFTALSAVFLCLLLASLFLIGQTSGKGSAINVSGSLRMQSYVLALTVARTQESSFEVRKKDISGAVAEFERRLLSKELTAGIPEDPSNQLRIEYNSVHHDFYESIRPLAIELINNPSLNTEFFKRIPPFVDQVDAFVLDLEKTLDDQINDLETVIFASLAAVILASVLFFIYLRNTLFRPLGDLSSLASQVRGGNFNVRSSYEKKNEIGELAQTMNYMVEDLSRMYSSLEEQVRTKTADLNLQNKSLNLLYSLKDLLTSETLSEPVLEKALSLVNQALGTCSCCLFLHDGSAQTVRLAAKADNGLSLTDSQLQSFVNEASISRYCITTKHIDSKELTIQQSPASSSQVKGILQLIYCGRSSFTYKETFVHSIALIFIEAIESTENAEENRRLAVLEERSTIARELHDSIAQSLAFSKIQLTRLNHAITQNSSESEQLGIVNELRAGVNDAYRHLREVLVAFRLRPESANLKQNILQIVKEFSERSSLQIHLEDTLQNFELNSNQQIHLLQILREALTNVEKHARATKVGIFLGGTSNGKIRLCVSDNGIGFDSKNAGRRGHFGLSIMNERAKALGGTVGISKNISGGTLVTVEFLG